MQTTKELIACVKAAQGIESDYRLAKLLGVVNSAVTNWQTGRSQPDDLLGAKLAELAGQDPLTVVAELNAQRAKTMEGKALWMRMATQLREIAGQNVTAGIATAVVASALLPGAARAATPLHAESQAPLKLMLSQGPRRRRSSRSLARWMKSLRPSSSTLGASNVLRTPALAVPH